MKYIEIKMPNGTYHLPAEVVEDKIRDHYMNNSDFYESDLSNFAILDWVDNNINGSEVKDKMFLVEDRCYRYDFNYEFTNAEKRIVEV